jgi:putative ABC transport system permease protein
MKLIKLIFKNTMRHKLRTFLTIIGIGIAVIAFGVLRTVVTGWNAGVDATAANRLITRQAISFIFPLPYAYRDKIAKVPGVKNVSFANWFGGVYKDKNQFFARMGVDAETIFDVYPEYLISPKELEDFKKERNSCVVGSKIAEEYGFKIGDIIPLEGDIYPGRWEFVVKGIYKPRDDKTDATQMFFQWNYINERIQQDSPSRAGDVGWYIVQIENPARSAEISQQIDKLFDNSPAETKTETESAFAQGFLEAFSSIITAMNFMSFVIIGVIMLVLGNTMIMSARERTREYAVFKTLGFSGRHLTGLILGESLMISVIGGALGLFMSFPLIEGISKGIPQGMFPVFQLEPVTIIFAISASLLIGILSAIFPIHKALNTKIVDGFRFVG